MRIRAPPVHANLLCLIDGANEQAYLDREQLDIREVDLDVTRDDQAFVEDAVENIDQTLRTVWAQLVALSQVCLPLKKSSERTKIDVEILIGQPESVLELRKPVLQTQE